MSVLQNVDLSLAPRAWFILGKKNHHAMELFVDKKTKKRLEVLRQKLEKNQKLLKDAQAQTDDPEEIVNLQAQQEKIKAEIAELKK